MNVARFRLSAVLKKFLAIKGETRKRSEIKRGEFSGPQSFAEANNDFALALYEKLRQRPGNLFFSPFSIRTALGMTEAGARGETAGQMREALCISPSDETLHVGFADIVQRLNAAGGGDSAVVVTNSLWGQEGAPLQPGFLDLITRHYSDVMNLVDFRGGPDAARITINRWVEDKTQQKIRELIPSGGVVPDTRLVLVNAIYFNGIWALQFRKAATRDEPFHLEGGSKVQAPLMYQQDEILYLKAGGYQAVDLAYRGGTLSMLVLLPARKDGLRKLEKTLSARMLHDCETQMQTRLVKLFLPRFKITWGTVDIKEQLIALGMPLAFNPFEANFSGIAEREPPHEESLFISNVFHKAFVETNEEGTEAAASTAVSTKLLGSLPFLEPPPVPIFRADHPFLFVIRDRKSGAILFLGRIANPALKQAPLFTGESVSERPKPWWKIW